jgi:hypothetical protein
MDLDLTDKINVFNNACRLSKPPHLYNIIIILVAVCLSCRSETLERWDRRFESCCGHGCPSLESVLCCVGSGLCDKLIACLENS